MPRGASPAERAQKQYDNAVAAVTRAEAAYEKAHAAYAAASQGLERAKAFRAYAKQNPDLPLQPQEGELHLARVGPAVMNTEGFQGYQSEVS